MDEDDEESSWTTVGGGTARHRQQQMPLPGIGRGRKVKGGYEGRSHVWTKDHLPPRPSPPSLAREEGWSQTKSSRPGPESVGLQECSSGHQLKERTGKRTDLHDLIGAPVVVGGAMPSRDHAPPFASRRRAGGLLQVDMSVVTRREKGGGVGGDETKEEQFDLSAESWPGIGGEVGGGGGCVVEPAASAWSKVVKTAPPPRPRPPHPKDSEERASADTASDSEGGGEGGGGGASGKKKRKRRKKNKSSSQSQESRRDKPVQLALGDLFTQLGAPRSSSVQKASTVFSTGVAVPVPPKQREEEKEGEGRGKGHADTVGTVPYNMLDSSAPVMRRGKERELPKKKKQTAIRKVITKEKEEKKRLREAGLPIPNDLDVSKKKEDLVEEEEEEEVGKKEENEVEKDEDVMKEEEEKVMEKCKVTGTAGAAVSDAKCPLHNRRFRDYCDHIVTDELNDCVIDLMTDLVRFQDRVYKNEPLKLKTKRRYVCGLREVRKALLVGLRKVLCVLVPPNLDKIQSTGGVDDQLAAILTQSHQQGIPVVFCLSRRRLAWVLKKRHHVGCAAIFSYAGAEDKFHHLMTVVEAARESYQLKQHPVSTPDDLGDLSNQSNALPDDSLSRELAAGDGNESQSSSEEEQEPVCSATIPSTSWGHLFGNGHLATGGGGGGGEDDGSAGSFLWNPNAVEFVPRSFKT